MRLMPGITEGQAIDILAHEFGHANNHDKGVEGTLSGQLLNPNNPASMGAQNMDEFEASRTHDAILKELKAAGVDLGSLNSKIQLPGNGEEFHELPKEDGSVGPRP